ncbi:uncharacterized protein LOC111052325 [Nilaparvata lugens]|uniref:uncharacterized protein LOC111052325 n=1 Tax=Nilaparvata lugens TaxID=108931 RepID=UPI00193D0886|nr:uncharacterized protein LOC111052325 [Nilaparvata lugens]
MESRDGQEVKENESQVEGIMKEKDEQKGEGRMENNTKTLQVSSSSVVVESGTEDLAKTLRNVQSTTSVIHHGRSSKSGGLRQVVGSLPPIGENKTENSIPESYPIYFGIKSYIQDFYYPPDAHIINSGEYVQDDFEFVIEPGKRRWRNLWFRIGLWGGINLLMLGIIALLVGHLTPPRETVVARLDNLEILDRWAITFNSRLQLCRLTGVTLFCIGGIVLMLTLLISIYKQEGEAAFFIVDTSRLVAGTNFTPSQSKTSCSVSSRIPLSGILKPVQPLPGQ